MIKSFETCFSYFDGDPIMLSVRGKHCRRW